MLNLLSIIHWLRVTTMSGDVLLRGSSGRLGYKGARKGMPFAASQIGGNLAKDMLTMVLRMLKLIWKDQDQEEIL